MTGSSLCCDRETLIATYKLCVQLIIGYCAGILSRLQMMRLVFSRFSRNTHCEWGCEKFYSCIVLTGKRYYYTRSLSISLTTRFGGSTIKVPSNLKTQFGFAQAAQGECNALSFSRDNLIISRPTCLLDFLYLNINVDLIQGVVKYEISDSQLRYFSMETIAFRYPENDGFMFSRLALSWW